MIHLTIVAILMGVAFAAGAVAFSRRESRWLWAGTILCATVGFGVAAIATMLFLFAKTWPMDDPMTPEAWLRLGSQAAGIGVVCLAPFAGLAMFLGRSARRKDETATTACMIGSPARHHDAGRSPWRMNLMLIVLSLGCLMSPFLAGCVTPRPSPQPSLAGEWTTGGVMEVRTMTLTETNGVVKGTGQRWSDNRGLFVETYDVLGTCKGDKVTLGFIDDVPVPVFVRYQYHPAMKVAVTRQSSAGTRFFTFTRGCLLETNVPLTRGNLDWANVPLDDFLPEYFFKRPEDYMEFQKFMNERR